MTKISLPLSLCLSHTPPPPPLYVVRMEWNEQIHHLRHSICHTDLQGRLQRNTLPTSSHAYVRSLPALLIDSLHQATMTCSSTPCYARNMRHHNQTNGSSSHKSACANTTAQSTSCDKQSRRASIEIQRALQEFSEHSFSFFT